MLVIDVGSGERNAQEVDVVQAVQKTIFTASIAAGKSNTETGR
jgi:hypothetical protein